MAAPKRSPTQIVRDRAEIARLYLMGVTQAEIGERLDMTQPMVSYDLKAIRALWTDSAIRDFDEVKSQELAKIDNLERTYWEAWERSLEQFKSKTIKAKGKNPVEAAANAEQTLKTEDRNGDPRFLEGVRWCIDRRCKIFGFDAPVKLNWQDTLPDGYDASEVLRQFTAMMMLAAKNDSTD